MYKMYLRYRITFQMSSRSKAPLIFSLLLILITLNSKAQSWLNFPLPDDIGTVKFIAAPEFDTTLSNDSLKVHTASEFYGNNELAIIVVDLNGSLGDEREYLLELALNYRDFLNNSLSISYADEPQISNTDAKNYSEFTWLGTDLELYTYDLKCLINPNALIVLIAIDSGDLPDDIKYTFMNGFQFAETN